MPRSAVLTQHVEFVRVVNSNSATGRVRPVWAARRRSSQRWLDPSILPSCRRPARGQHLAFHFGVVIRLVEQPRVMLSSYESHMNSLQSPTLRLHGSNAPPHSWTRSPYNVGMKIGCHSVCHSSCSAPCSQPEPMALPTEGCHLRRRGERNRIRHHRLPAAALLAVWKVSHAMNPTKSAAPIPKIHRVALVDNDPRALESLSLLIEAKVPTGLRGVDGHFRRRSDRTLPKERRQSQPACIGHVHGGLAGASHLPSDPSHGQASADSGHHQLLHQQLP